MRLDPHGVAAAVALLVLLALLFPKRSWSSLRARLRLVAAGERQYPYGPPAGQAELSPHPVLRALQLIGAELPRAFELGLPLHLVSTRLESLGARRRASEDEECRESWSGLLLRHLRGEMTEEEFLGRLRERSLPPPATKLVWTPPPTFTLPRNFWEMRRDWDRRLEELGREAPAQEAAHVPAGPDQAEEVNPAGGSVDPASIAAASQSKEGAAPRLEIRTLGEISIRVDGVDIAPRLLHRAADACPVLYLMTREVLRPGDRITRAVLADLLFPRTARDQRRKLSRRISALKNEVLPRPLAERIRVEGEFVRLDLSDCPPDVRRVLDTARQLVDTAMPLTDAEQRDAEDALRLAEREYLTGWEETERRGTGGESGMTAAIEEVRDLVVGARMQIVNALADSHLAAGRPEEAVPYLQDALRCRPERVHLARKLADAYERCEQHQRAAAVRQEYGLNEASS